MEGGRQGQICGLGEPEWETCCQKRADLLEKGHPNKGPPKCQ